MAVTPKLCVLTIHGIGFQQPPDDQHAGYADTLHDNLAAVLNGRLGDDPQRPAGVHGPVYVMSAMPGTHNKDDIITMAAAQRPGYAGLVLGVLVPGMLVLGPLCASVVMTKI